MMRWQSIIMIFMDAAEWNKVNRHWIAVPSFITKLYSKLKGISCNPPYWNFQTGCGQKRTACSACSTLSQLWYTRRTEMPDKGPFLKSELAGVFVNTPMSKMAVETTERIFAYSGFTQLVGEMPEAHAPAAKPSTLSRELSSKLWSYARKKGIMAKYD